MYTDSSFSLEIFSNKRGGEQLYTQSKFSGKWNKRNDTLSLQYLNRQVNAIAGNGRNVFSSEQTLLRQVPTFCVIADDMLITNSILTDNLHISKNKALALNEKWAYENEQRAAVNSSKKNLRFE